MTEVYQNWWTESMKSAKKTLVYLPANEYEFFLAQKSLVLENEDTVFSVLKIYPFQTNNGNPVNDPVSFVNLLVESVVSGARSLTVEVFSDLIAYFAVAAQEPNKLLVADPQATVIVDKILAVLAGKHDNPSMLPFAAACMSFLIERYPKSSSVLTEANLCQLIKLLLSRSVYPAGSSASAANHNPALDSCLSRTGLLRLLSVSQCYHSKAVKSELQSFICKWMERIIVSAMEGSNSFALPDEEPPGCNNTLRFAMETVIDVLSKLPSLVDSIDYFQKNSWDHATYLLRYIKSSDPKTATLAAKLWKTFVLHFIGLASEGNTSKTKNTNIPAEILVDISCKAVFRLKEVIDQITFQDFSSPIKKRIKGDVTIDSTNSSVEIGQKRVIYELFEYYVLSTVSTLGSVSERSLQALTWKTMGNQSFLVLDLLVESIYRQTTAIKALLRPRLDNNRLDLSPEHTIYVMRLSVRSMHYQVLVDSIIILSHLLVDGWNAFFSTNFDEFTLHSLRAVLIDIQDYFDAISSGRISHSDSFEEKLIDNFRECSAMDTSVVKLISDVVICIQDIQASRQDLNNNHNNKLKHLDDNENGNKIAHEQGNNFVDIDQAVNQNFSSSGMDYSPDILRTQKYVKDEKGRNVDDSLVDDNLMDVTRISLNDVNNNNDVDVEDELQQDVDEQDHENIHPNALNLRDKNLNAVNLKVTKKTLSVSKKVMSSTSMLLSDDMIVPRSTLQPTIMKSNYDVADLAMEKLSTLDKKLMESNEIVQSMIWPTKTNATELVLSENNLTSELIAENLSLKRKSLEDDTRIAELLSRISSLEELTHQFKERDITFNDELLKHQLTIQQQNATISSQNAVITETMTKLQTLAKSEATMRNEQTIVTKKYEDIKSINQSLSEKAESLVIELKTSHAAKEMQRSKNADLLRSYEHVLQQYQILQQNNAQLKNQLEQVQNNVVPSLQQKLVMMEERNRSMSSEIETKMKRITSLENETSAVLAKNESYLLTIQSKEVVIKSMETDLNALKLENSRLSAENMSLQDQLQKNKDIIQFINKLSGENTK